jgi:hypothetical protein
MTPLGPLGSTHDLVIKDDHKVDADVFDEGVKDNENRAQALPPVDGGKAAWLFLASCYLLEVSASNPSRLELDLTSTCPDIHCRLNSSCALVLPSHGRSFKITCSDRSTAHCGTSRR